MGLLSFIRSKDQFGHGISINFKGDGSHNTSIGGLCTILVEIFLIYFIALKFKKMVNYESNSISYGEEAADFKAIGEVTLGDAKFFPYITIKDASKFNAVSFETINPLRYLTSIMYDVEETTVDGKQVQKPPQNQS